MVVQVQEEKQSAEFYLQALMLAEVVKRILERKAEIKLSAKPSFQMLPVTDFMKRMRVTGLSKFDGKVFMSSINFYEDYEELEKNNAAGVVILYFSDLHVVRLMQDLGYPIEYEDDEDAIEDACGAFCNLVAGNFKSGLTQLGYKEIVMSHFSTFQNEVINGLPYCRKRPQVYEVSFEIKGVKTIVMELNMGQLPKSGYFYL